jgi:hypothetical protein
MVEYRQTLLQKQAVGPLAYFLLSNKEGNANVCYISGSANFDRVRCAHRCDCRPLPDKKEVTAPRQAAVTSKPVTGG